jgi:hypothetical protein
LFRLALEPKQTDLNLNWDTVGRELGLSKNTVAGIVKRAQTASVKP